MSEGLGIIGAGVMGSTLAAGLLESKWAKPQTLWASARSEKSCKKIESAYGIKAVRDFEDEVGSSSVLLLCVKPKQMTEVLGRLKKSKLKPSTLVISIVSGVTTEDIEAVLGKKQPVIRAMTNTPCQVRQGMTTICAGNSATASHLETANGIFSAVGKCVELEEKHFDAVTGLCGSGPAYIYLMMEALADGGVRVGLPRKEALQMIYQTVLGAAVMAQKTNKHPSELREDVTTPAGCTIGALLILEDGKIRSVLARAVEEAASIASKLGGKGK